MFFFERRGLVLIVLTCIFLVTLYQYKLSRHLSRYNGKPRYTPTSGDVLLFFSHKSGTIIDWLFWKGIMTLHTNIPVRHYGIVIDDAHYIEVQHPDTVKYDHLTRTHVRGFPRVAKLKEVRKDWTSGEIMVVKTGVTVNPETILNDFENRSYWRLGGCLGFVNRVYRTIDPTCPFFLSVEGILRHYKNAKIGHANV